jgi:hypothetical protein
MSEPRWYWWLYTSAGWVPFANCEMWRGSMIAQLDRTLRALTCTDDPGDWMPEPQMSVRALWNPALSDYATVFVLRRRHECASLPGGGGAPSW